MPVDVADRAPTSLPLAHTRHGPMGIGVLWGKMDLLNAMPPMLTGEMMTLLPSRTVWAPVPEIPGRHRRAGIFATGAALDYLVNTVGYENISTRQASSLPDGTHAASTVRSSAPSLDNHHGVVSFNRASTRDVASIWTWTASAAPVTTVHTAAHWLASEPCLLPRQRGLLRQGRHWQVIAGLHRLEHVQWVICTSPHL
ncbi:MAG: aminotransferase class V-fold PLP-dependent enzyme [Collinsella sp.]